MSIFLENIRDHSSVIQGLHVFNNIIAEIALLASKTVRNGGKILFCGNGGSAADSQHLASELTGKFLKEREPIAAIALSTDCSALTCIGNDYSFGEIFARQIIALGHKNDLLIAISTSGHSLNVIRAAEEARKLGIHTVGLLGRDGGKLSDLCSLSVIVPSTNTARIQECHILIGHTICEMVEQHLL